MNPDALKQILAAYGRLLLLAVVVICGVGALAGGVYAVMLHVELRGALQVGASTAGLAVAKDQPTTGTLTADGGTTATQPAATPTPTPAPTPRPPAQLPEELAKIIAAKRIFGPPPAGAPQVTSVLGDSAMINGQWMKVGVKQGDIEVKEIHPDKVVFEFQGNRQETSLFQKLPTQPLDKSPLQRPTPKPSPTPAAATAATTGSTATLTASAATTATTTSAAAKSAPTPTQTPGKDGKKP